MMKKKWIILFAALMMIAMLAACNTSEERARESQRNNLNQVSFGPEDQGMQGDGNQPREMDPGAYGQNRFDANIPFEGMNPNGTNGSMQGPYFFDHDGRYTQDPQGGDPAQRQSPNQAEQNRDDTAQQQSDQANGDFQQQVIDLTNKAREKNGLKPLKNSNDVEEVAQTKSEDMAKNDYFSHTSPTYGSPFDMLKEFGVNYSTAAENIAAGQQSPQSVVDGWLNSSGHRKNIMNKNITHIGVGYAKDGNYWVQMFIAK